MLGNKGNAPYQAPKYRFYYLAFKKYFSEGWPSIFWIRITGFA